MRKPIHSRFLCPSYHPSIDCTWTEKRMVSQRDIFYRFPLGIGVASINICMHRTFPDLMRQRRCAFRIFYENCVLRHNPILLTLRKVSSANIHARTRYFVLGIVLFLLSLSLSLSLSNEKHSTHVRELESANHERTRLDTPRTIVVDVVDDVRF